MSYQFDFLSAFDYAGVFAHGIKVTAELTAMGGVLGVTLGIACAWARTQGPAWLAAVAGGYVELIRNKLFFIFFGLPSAGVQLGEIQAAILAMVINLGAYSAEIVRAGIAAVPRGQLEAGASLAMSPFQVFRHVVLRPALKKIWPALSSQVVIVMLGSAVCSQIAVEDLTFAANFVQGRNFRAFEVYLLTTAIYLLLAIGLRQVLRGIGGMLFRRAS